MSFVPRLIEAGDYVRLRVALENREGTFGAGHRFEVITVHFGSHPEPTTYDLRDHDVHLLFDVPAEDVELDAPSTSSG